MIPRYTRAEMAAIWAPDYRLRLWLEIELCALEAMAAIGQVPRVSLCGWLVATTCCRPVRSLRAG